MKNWVSTRMVEVLEVFVIKVNKNEKVPRVGPLEGSLSLDMFLNTLITHTLLSFPLMTDTLKPVL